jgi:hypothetical protein
MGLFDKVIEAVSDVVSDVVEDVSNGDFVGAAVELTTGPLGLSNIGDIAQEQIEVFVEAGVDSLQGEEVSLEYDPEVIPAIAEAGVEDGENFMEIYTEMG